MLQEIYSGDEETSQTSKRGILDGTLGHQTSQVQNLNCFSFKNWIYILINALPKSDLAGGLELSHPLHKFCILYLLYASHIT